MSDFSFSIGAPEGAAKTVPVTFTVAGLNYSRMVNAVFRGDTYDADETALRVLDVGRGVLNKISLGVLKEDGADIDPNDGQGYLPLGEVPASA